MTSTDQTGEVINSQIAIRRYPIKTVLITASKYIQKHVNESDANFHYVNNMK